MLKKNRHTRISMHSCEEMSLDLAEGDEDKFIRFFAGVSRLSFENGKVVDVPTYRTPPEPVDDPVVEPHWPQQNNRAMAQTAFNFPKELSEHASPGIVISHLCGYNWTEENYRKEARKLEHWGFDCLRSRRREDGRYREQWVLPALWQAKNELKEIVDAKRDPFAPTEWERQTYPSYYRRRKRRMLKNKNGELTNLQKLRNAVEFLRRNVEFGTLDITVQRLAMVLD